MIPHNTELSIYDSYGNLVATKLVNQAASGQEADTSGIVEFDGLVADTAYSLVIRYDNGSEWREVGGLKRLNGQDIKYHNPNWASLTPNGGDETYVLAAKAGYNNHVTDPVYRNLNLDYYSNDYTLKSEVNSASSLTGTSGNDIFYAEDSTLYRRMKSPYNSNSWLIIRDLMDSSILGGYLPREYVGGDGVDTVDYDRIDGSYKWNLLSGGFYFYSQDSTLGITVDLSKTGAQWTGYDHAIYSSIEAIGGSKNADTLTDSADDNIFNGRGGDDIFYLINGGFDTLLYEVIDNGDGTGGNGTDTVHGFTTGMYGIDDSADRIDLSALLIGYVADADGPAHWINGSAVIDAGDNITSYLKTEQGSNGTKLFIDRDGDGGDYGWTELLIMKDVWAGADLASLLANQQIIVG